MAYPKDIIVEVIYTEEELKTFAKQLGEQITKDYEEKYPTLVCTLKGAVPFFSELIKHVTCECEMEFIKASSYIGNTTTTIGNVTISAVLGFPIKDRDIIIVEDIVDTGLTCKELTKYFLNLGARSVEICTLLDKPARRTCSTFPKYIGAEIDDKFIIGYGLDYNEKYRNIPYVGVINPKYI